MPTDRTQSLIDAQVQAARERGDFDRLRGHGKPLELDDMQGLTAAQRLEALLMRSLGEVMPEVTLVREVRAARAQLRTLASDSAAHAALSASLESKIAQLTQALKERRSARKRGE